MKWSEIQRAELKVDMLRDLLREAEQELFNTIIKAAMRALTGREFKLNENITIFIAYDSDTSCYQFYLKDKNGVQTIDIRQAVEMYRLYPEFREFLNKQ